MQERSSARFAAIRAAKLAEARVASEAHDIEMIGRLRLLGRRTGDHDTIVHTFMLLAANNGGIINPNQVREHLQNSSGEIMVNPRVLSDMYRQLMELGVITRTKRKVPNTDWHGKNNDKECWLYRWTGPDTLTY